MLTRWIGRWRWRRSAEFRATVERTLQHTLRVHGLDALAHARRKLRRSQQPIRRKWGWRAVVERLNTDTHFLIVKHGGAWAAERVQPFHPCRALPDTGSEHLQTPCRALVLYAAQLDLGAIDAGQRDSVELAR
jgi:hypothetical protein